MPRSDILRAHPRNMPHPDIPPTSKVSLGINNSIPDRKAMPDRLINNISPGISSKMLVHRDMLLHLTSKVRPRDIRQVVTDRDILGIKITTTGKVSSRVDLCKDIVVGHQIVPQIVPHHQTMPHNSLVITPGIHLSRTLPRRIPQHFSIPYPSKA